MKPFGKEIEISNKSDLFEAAQNLMSLMLENKVVWIRGVKDLSKEEFLEFSRLLAPDKLSDDEKFIQWDFGKVMDLKEDDQASNYLFSNEKVPYHWDGAFHECPKALVFHCIKASKEGGGTFFCDTASLLNDMDQELKVKLESSKLKYITSKLAHYGGELVQSLVETHPYNGSKILRYGERVNTQKNPVQRKIYSGTLSEEDLSLLDQSLYEPRYQLTHDWQDGDILIADNSALLHGRNSFNSQGRTRHIRRIQVR